jgi:hypothetical protein
MLDAILAGENIVHIGAALYLVGFLFRDQILLRAFVIAGDLVYILYFYFAPEVPLWGGIFWSAVFTGHTFHQRNQFTLRADAAHLGHFRLACDLDAVPVTDAFNLIGIELNGGPIAQRFRGGDEILIPVARGERFLQFSQRN